MSGLCNRMNAILCAVALQEECPADVSVYWESNRACGCTYDDLFRPFPHPRVRVYPLTDFYLKPLDKRKWSVAAEVRKFLFDLCLDGNQPEVVDVVPLLKRHKRVYVESYNRFSVQEIKCDVGRFFRPTEELEAEIRRVTNSFPSYTVGLHIRRTDNVWSMQSHPLEKFEAAIERELRANEGACFYLASDDEDVKRHLTAKYGHRIRVRKSDLQRSSKAGMQDALVELYCLAHTRKIYGCRHSTYSLMASWLYGAELVL